MNSIYCDRINLSTSWLQDIEVMLIQTSKTRVLIPVKSKLVALERTVQNKAACNVCVCLCVYCMYVRVIMHIQYVRVGG